MSEFIGLPKAPEGPKIVGRVELPETPEERRRKLKNFVSRISSETNERLKTELLDSSGRINMANYAIPEVAEDNYYSSSNIAKDQKRIEALETTWSEESGLSKEDWQKKRERNSSNSLEMMVSVVFHKFLSPRFVIAGTSKFDDYFRGADQVIVDTETGAAICNLDDMQGTSNDARGSQKHYKIIEAAKKGGTSIKYGFTFKREEGSNDLAFVRRPLQNLPTFCLSVSSEETAQLLKNMKYDSNQVSGPESAIFSKLLESLEAQHQLLSSQPEVPHSVRNNLESFASSLVAMRELAEAKNT